LVGSCSSLQRRRRRPRPRPRRIEVHSQYSPSRVTR
jgi:hypothetical protein